MTAIGELLARDLSRKIEEIVKVDQADEESVFTELTEYVATERLRERYRDLFRVIAEGPADPTEGVGVWVSGFFGSGKSSFAKNVGYVLANRMVLGKKAADLFKAQVHDPVIESLIDSINSRIPTEVVMFDVQTDRAIGGSGNVSISHYMYRSLLRALDYAEDFEIAELEQTLEADGKLPEFEERCKARYGAEWKVRRKRALKFNEASALLQEMDGKTYPEADSWAKAVKRIEVTPTFLVQKVFELATRRCEGSGLAFVIDEVGGYVARSTERIEDLRAVVEQLGKESKNRVKARKAVAPVWVLVTSQEKLDEVVAALDSKRVELAKLQDRFPIRIDIGPSDIREVVQKRVLAKKAEARTILQETFTENDGALNAHLKLERSGRKTELTAETFAAFYPYPPHFVELSIDIMSGIRLQPGAARHLGGSNRTIIRQAFEMLVSERTALAKAEVGRLVTLDLVFDLVEGNLASEKQKDVSDICAQFGPTSWEARVAKAIVLLEFVRDVPRTERNLAAVLYDRVGGASCLAEVETALKALSGARFVRHAEDGYKLQTASEKSWETERRALDPRPRDRSEIRREVVREVFSEPALRSFSFRGMKAFKIELTVDDVKLEDGQIPLKVVSAESPELLEDRLSKVQMQSRPGNEPDCVFLVFALMPEIDENIGELYRSRQMVNRYSQAAAQGRITAEESSCLSSEREQVNRLLARLREGFATALQGGCGFFRGVSMEGASLGKTLPEVVKQLFEKSVPQLYDKLEMGIVSLKGDEAEEVLKAANLSGLSPVFYEGDGHLGLVRKEGAKFVPRAEAPVAKEVLDFIRQRAQYGEKVTGKDLEAKFSGLCYGWDRDLLRLVLAVLLRAGAVEVTYQGRRYRNHQDPMSRQPFSGPSTFRVASFAPRESVSLKTLAVAAERMEELTGQEVDVEEGAIAQALKKLAEQERSALVGTLAVVRANGLPVDGALSEYEGTLKAILESASDDCVKLLAGEGKSLRDAREAVRKVRDIVEGKGLDTLKAARRVARELWPALAGLAVTDGFAAHAEELSALLGVPGVYEKLARVRELAEVIEARYGEKYGDLHERRSEAVGKRVGEIRSYFGWTKVPEEYQDLCRPLLSKGCDALARDMAAPACNSCRATLAQLESDLEALPAVTDGILRKLLELAAPPEKTERVVVRQLCLEPLGDKDAVLKFVKGLEERLLKLISEGVRVVIE